jgi:hypothetical protein
MRGSLQLREYLGAIVRLSCPKCGRAGQYRKEKLIEHYGADMPLPDLREEIANCSRCGQWHDGCMVRYVDLGGARHTRYVLDKFSSLIARIYCSWHRPKPFG